MERQQQIIRGNDLTGGNGNETPVLSETKLQILNLFARGMTYEMVAAELSMSPSTLNNHITLENGIFDKLNVTSREAAVFYLVHGGLVQEDKALESVPYKKYPRLSDRQLDILHTMTRKGAGTNERELMETLGISLTTLNYHLRTIYRETGVNSIMRAGLLYLAHEKGTIGISFVRGVPPDTKGRETRVYPDGVELTHDENKVLLLLVMGLTPIEVAGILQMPVKKIDKLVYSSTGIYAKLGVNTRRGLVLESLRRGIVVFPDQEAKDS